MTIFDVLTLIGGLCLFLFGMNVMGQGLENRAGSSLRDLLSKMTTNKVAGLFTGLGVTAVIQSSSATTVMVVGFVNSGLMTLKQAINVIMGANIGTTVTAWILSLGGISGDTLVLQLLKPMSFTPILALIGIVLFMFCKSDKKRATGSILLGFAVLMFGMDIMTNSVSGLADIPAFRELFLMFKNPILGVVAGAVLTAIIQSSSASVGILQALAATGAVSFGAAVPIIMGQNIGTCITAILSSFGTNRNAKRAALVHLSFNVIGTIVWLSVFSIVNALFSPAIFDANATQANIAIAHSSFNIACTILLLPMSSLLEKLAYRLVPDTAEPEKVVEFDERLLESPAIALTQCQSMTVKMAESAIGALKDSITCLTDYTPELDAAIRAAENDTDHYEDVIGTYLVKLSSLSVSNDDSREAARLLKLIGDLERISDHAVNVLESALELREKNIVFSEMASRDLSVLCNAVRDILDTSMTALCNRDIDTALAVEPLEQVIDTLKEALRSRHIVRMQKGECSIGAGFIWGDLLTDLERTSDHCSNIAGGIIDLVHGDMNMHEALKRVRSDESEFARKYKELEEKYTLA